MPPEPIDRFEKLFEDWASRAPATPPDEAARQVLRRLPAAPSPRPVPWFRTVVTAAAALAVLVVSTRFYPRGTSPGPVAQDTTMGLIEAPVVPDGVALVWLDSGTPLYLTLTVPPMSKGDPPS